MTPTVKKIIIAAIILAVIVISVIVYKKSKQDSAHPNRVVPPVPMDETKQATVAPAGTPGSKGHPIG